MVKVGDVLYLFMENTTPPKNKFIFVLGMNKDKAVCATFLVNSSINLNVNNNAELVKFNIKLSAVEYPFLSYDSYLDCNFLTTKDLTEINSIVAKRPTAKVYSLSDDKIQFFKDIISQCPIHKGKILKNFGFYD